MKANKLTQIEKELSEIEGLTAVKKFDWNFLSKKPYGPVIHSVIFLMALEGNSISKEDIEQLITGSFGEPAGAVDYEKTSRRKKRAGPFPPLFNFEYVEKIGVERALVERQIHDEDISHPELIDGKMSFPTERDLMRAISIVIYPDRDSAEKQIESIITS